MKPSPEEVDPLDRGIALCLADGEDGRRALVAWLAEFPELAEELAHFLAEDLAFHRETAPLREAMNPVETPTATQGGSGGPRTAPAAFSLHDFELCQELGRGGMGVVFYARQRSLNRVVALKTTLGGGLLSERELTQFRFEAEAAAGLDHPNIVPIYGAGEQDGVPFFFMKFISGGTLSERSEALRNQPRAAAALLAQVAGAVHYAHQRGILHRDLKPSNILIDRDGEPMIADFGLAKSVGGDAASHYSTGVVGTASYMAPEQARAEKGLTTAVDVYALGGVLYHLLTGEPPFRGETPFETIRQVLEQNPVRPHELNASAPPDLEAICLKCLEKRPEDRYASAASLESDLRRFADGEAISLRSDGLLHRMGRAIGGYRMALGRPKNNWLFQAAMMSLVWIATHATIYSLIVNEATIGSVWIVLGVYFPFLLLTRIRQERRSRDCTPWERHAVTVWTASSSATFIAALGLIPFDFSAPASAILPWYPCLATLYFLCTIVMASISWGGSIFAAFAFAVLAISLKFVGTAAPLVLGIGMSVILTANGYAFMRYASRRVS